MPRHSRKHRGKSHRRAQRKAQRKSRRAATRRFRGGYANLKEAFLLSETDKAALDLANKVNANPAKYFGALAAKNDTAGIQGTYDRMVTANKIYSDVNSDMNMLKTYKNLPISNYTMSRLSTDVRNMQGADFVIPKSGSYGPSTSYPTTARVTPVPIGTGPQPVMPTGTGPQPVMPTGTGPQPVGTSTGTYVMPKHVQYTSRMTDAGKEQFLKLTQNLTPSQAEISSKKPQWYV